MTTATQPKAKKPVAQKKPPSHPPFAEMITDAIVSLKERTGSSQYAITKFIEAKHKDLPPTFRKLLLNYLKKSVAAGKLVKVKNSFKLPPARSAPAKAAAAAAATKKPKALSKAGAKPNAKAAPKQKAVAKPKSKSVAASAKPKARAAGKKVAAKPARKAPVKGVKKPKSVKSPSKKVAAKKAKK